MQGSSAERGAIAVMAAALSVVMFVAAAFAVDLGQAYVVRRDTQNSADSAALAGAGIGGANLPVTTTGGSCPYGPRASTADQAILDTVTYLNDNDSWSHAVSASELVDCDLTNGEAAYGRFVSAAGGATLAADVTQLSVIAPQRHVAFSFGQTVDVGGVDLSAQATVQIKSPEMSTLPFYAFTGCDYGAQTIAQPTNGHAADIVLLANPADTNAAVFTTPTATLPNPATTPYSSPAAVPLDVTDPNDVIQINGSGLGAVSDIGFFESGVVSSGPDPVTVPIANAVSASSTQISLHLPTVVASTQTVWYIRVKIGSTWSRATHTQGGSLILDALPLQVGSPTLTCGQGSMAGNFGTLKLTNSQGPTGQSANIAYNIAAGVEHSVATYPLASAIPILCTTLGLAPLRLTWPHDPTNCVDTKTGLDLDAAQAGFLDGVAGRPGRLHDIEDGGCAADGVPSSTLSLRTASGTAITQPSAVNNDTLSCFLTDSTTTVGDIASGAYDGGPVLSQKIYQSARFALVPVLGMQPDSGGSKLYTVIDLRPAFITDESMAATSSYTLPTSSHNGVTLSDTGQHGIASVQIIFFSSDALPPPPDGVGLEAWFGSGAKRVVLVD
ncbi:TadE/TadG family type IV pilus assembly protein [Nocardioides sp. Kera G14]|uniref:TadE/TadG family type IV pilus assembly protein n=1 Tax=Nocardioides sp. Kera G14 TaxID=2884264 RepID=UPI001D10BF2E|nr:Tad domain-containing protein [Nocardioides sp. Kera G14]UDY22638.1 Tad domain-containing protein [Nocardioides sp. Kera G14]